MNDRLYCLAIVRIYKQGLGTLQNLQGLPCLRTCFPGSLVVIGTEEMGKQYQRAEQPDSKSQRMTEWKDGKFCSGTFGVPLIPTGLAHSMQRKSNTIEQLNGSGGLKYDFKALHLHL